MVYFVKLKAELKKNIMVALNKGKKLSKKKLVAQLCLDTGITEKPILRMLEQLETVGYLKITDDEIKKSRR